MWWNKNKKDEFLMTLKQELGEVESDVSLAKISYLKIGGLAQYYFGAKTKEDLIKSVRLARKLDLPHLVIGASSNLLFLDKGFQGLIIKNNYAAKDAIYINGSEVIAPSGIILLVLIKELGQKGLGGIEFLAPIPGTLGGAIVSAVEANKKEIKNFLVGVNVLDFNGEVKFVKKEKLGLKYRQSKLKGLAKARNYLKYPVILEAKLKLMPRSKEEVERLVQSVFLMRQKSQPQGISLGCTFKNPKIEFDKHSFPDEAISNGRVSCGYLLDKGINFKGKKIGRIQLSKIHANFFINLGGAKSDHYLKLVEEVKEKVKEKYNLDLKEEIEIIEN
ncbi:MAG: UDP-N-acetylmuramate dehydrogenase [Patescibacteria group bacterium]|nr:UDP-N-acetylmuramate dehydrogenase [Patescibacteria group bacterium]